MHLTPKEQDKLTLLTLGMIAERRLKKGLKLNHPESVMEGVADMIDLLQVEAVFTDGSRLVSIHHPIK